MTRVSGDGVRVEIPSGWEGRVKDGGLRLLANGAKDTTVVHIGSFALPPDAGSFGSGAVELMRTTDVLMVLFEYGAESLGTSLFAQTGIPTNLAADDFDRDALQRALPGQSGLQRFFTVSGRAFCLYVVLGSHLDRADLIPEVNAVLDSLEIS